MVKQPIFGKDPEKISRLLSIGEDEEDFKEVHSNVEDASDHSKDQTNKQFVGSELDSSATEENVIEKLHTNIEGYRIMKVLGEGGMGIVYLAEQQYPVRRLVALKIIKPGMDSQRVMARFEAEQQALAWLDHPNIAQVFDAGTTETSCPFFVMEYVKGMSITEYCDHYKCSIEQRLRLFQRVCQAVQHAHQKGIIHRDIKPSNILVSIVDDQAVPKIIDFGVAKAIVQPLTEGMLYTEQGQLFGTPEYMSPEQADMAIEDIDTRSDIYSLGVLLYELLTGVLPFDPQMLREGGLEHIRKVIRETDPKTPSTRLTRLGEEAKRIAEYRRTDIGTLAKNLRKELEWIPLKAMRKERIERYRSASELADDIENYLIGNPLMAGPLTVSYRLKKFVRRNKKVFAGVVVVAVSLVIGLTVSTISLVRAQHARQIAVAAQEKEVGLREQAQANELEMRRIAYASDMSLAQQALKMNDMGRARQLLDAHRSAAGKDDLRGWEWRYLWQKCRSDALGELCRYEGSSPISVAYSPDGKVLAVAGIYPGFVDIWDVTRRERIEELQWKEGFRLAFSPRGDLLATSAEGQIRLWRTDTWDRIDQNQLPVGAKFLRFSPDGTRLARLTFGGELTVWEISQWPVIRQIGGGRPGAAGLRRLDFSPDGKALVIADANDDLNVIDLATGDTILGPWEAHSERITSVAWSPNGSVIASGSGWEGGPIQLWDATSGESLGELKGHTSWVSDLLFSEAKDGLRLYSASGDQTIRIWDVGQQRCLGILRGSRHEVLGLALSPDGTTLASACKDGIVTFWSAIPQQEEPMPRTIPLRHFSRPVFAPDSRVLAVPQEDTVSLFDLTTAKETELRPKMDADVSAIAYSPDGTLLVSGSKKGTIRVWSCAGGSPLKELDDHKEEIILLRFRTNGARLFSLDAKGKAIWWDTLTWQAGQILAMQLPDRSEPWQSKDISPDGRLLALGTREGAVRWLSAETGEFLATTDGAQPISQVAFSNDGSRLASTSVYGTMVLWDPSSFRSVRSFRAHLLAADGVAFSPDGRRLATGGTTSRDTLRLWDLLTHRELITLSGQPVATSFVTFSPDSRWLVACSKNEGKLHIWCAPSWEEIEADEKRLESGQSPLQE